MRLLKPNRSADDISFSKIPSDLRFDEVDKKLGSPSDLNIPEELVPFISKLIQETGSLRLLLSQCLRKKTLIYLVELHTPKIKVCYQKQRLGLIRYSFRPYAKDWIKLKELASAHRVSMCKMFVELLEMEFFPPKPNLFRPLGFGGDNILPPIIPLTSIDQHIQPKRPSLPQDNEIIQIAS